MGSIHYHKFNPKTWASPQSNMLRRSRFMGRKSHPWPAQIRDNLGSVLGNIVLGTLPLEIQEIIGIKKRLNGPGKQLWNSPSNQLLGKHKLIPYKSPREVLAFTHEKIQSLGEKIEKKIARRVVKKMLKLAYVQEELCKKSTEMKVNEMRKKTIREFYVLMSFRLRELHKQMKEDFKEAWDRREAQLLEESNLSRIKGNQAIKNAFACEMKTTAENLEHEFNTKLHFMVQWSRSNYRDEYLQRRKYLLHTWSELFESAKKQEDTRMKEMLEVIQTQNQIHFDAAILAERENAARVFLQVIQFYQDKLARSQEETDKLVSALQKIIEERNLAQMDASAWECALKDILGQFQKFINYVLKEIPGQAEYLLSLREIAKKRRECLPRIDRRVGQHKQMGHPIPPDTCWEDALKLTEQEIPRIRSGSSLNLPKTVFEEEEVELRPEDTLKEIANGESVVQTRQMIVEVTDWLLEGVKATRNTEQLESPSTGNAKTQGTQGRSKLSSLGQSKRSTSQKDRYDEAINKFRERVSAGGGPSVDGIENTPPEHCAGPFVQNRINSLLDIFDGHPHLKHIFIEP